MAAGGDSVIRGSCLCGEAAWEAEGPLELVTHCHCSMCRKAHGTAFATYGGAAAEGFRWLRGRERACRYYESSPGFFRPFCSRCGSVVAGDPARGRVFMPVGCLDGDPGSRPVAHIFAASKAPWHAIVDDLPRFDGYPPGFDAPEVPERPRSHAGEGRVAGSCLCGGVAYAIEGEIEAIRNCHCSRCRKARSAAHASNAFVGVDRFRWTRGEELLEAYKVPEASRFTHTFCGVCGSSLPRAHVERGYVVIPAGTLDDDPGAREREHIFVGSKAPWYTIADDLPQYDEYPPEARG
jgi:hypothetical protein